VSGQFVFGGGDHAIEAARVAGGRNRLPGDPEQQLVEGAVAQGVLAPGVAPWVSARAGLGGGNEAGLTYTGRTARIDARHAFGDPSLALSVGVGASAVLTHLEGDRQPPAAETAEYKGRIVSTPDDFVPSGWGIDVPILVGWRSSASVVEAWAGARGGVERDTGNLFLNVAPGADASGPPPLPPVEMRATRWYGGGLVGMAVGIKPLWIALELDVAYQKVNGGVTFPADAQDPHERSVRVDGLTVAPSGALVGKF
jgi:hypothetical protein